MERFQAFARDVATGDPLSEATITVYDVGTLDEADIFSDDLSTPTPKSNPFTADATTGYFFFYAANGAYDIQVEKSGFTTYTLSDVQLGRFTSIQGLTAAAIDFALGTSGNDLNITTPDADTVQLNVPNASATARGVITTGAQTLAGAKTFSTPIALDSGGTGLSLTPTDGQLLIGRSSDNTLQLATLTGTANQISVANGTSSITLSTPQNIHTGASPTFVGLTLSGLTASAALITNGSKQPTSVPMTDGQLLIGRTGGTPVAATLTAGAGIGITNASGSITIAFTAGAISSLNALTTSTQTFAVDTNGTDFNIVSSGSVHTFNIPDAGPTQRGLVTTANQTLGDGQKHFKQVPTFDPGISDPASATARVSGVLDVQTFDYDGSPAFVGNNLGAATDLFSYTIPANTMSIDGQVLRIVAQGSCTPSAGNADWDFMVDGSADLTTGAISMTSLSWFAEALVIRTGVGKMRAILRFRRANSAGASFLGPLDYSFGDVDWTAAVDISIRVTSAVATDDVIQGFFWMVEAL